MIMMHDMERFIVDVFRFNNPVDCKKGSVNVKTETHSMALMCCNAHDAITKGAICSTHCSLFSLFASNDAMHDERDKYTWFNNAVGKITFGKILALYVVYRNIIVRVARKHFNVTTDIFILYALNKKIYIWRFIYLKRTHNIKASLLFIGEWIQS